MATNWNAILSNANSLNDILMILRKVLAGLDAKADITLIDEALDDIGDLKIDVDGAINTINQAILDFENTGGYVTAANFSELNLITPSYDFQLARVEDTGDEYRWDPSASPSPAWVPTGKNYIQYIMDIINQNLWFNPQKIVAGDDFNNITKQGVYYHWGANLTAAQVLNAPLYVSGNLAFGVLVVYNPNPNDGKSSGCTQTFYPYADGYSPFFRKVSQATGDFPAWGGLVTRATQYTYIEALTTGQDVLTLPVGRYNIPSIAIGNSLLNMPAMPYKFGRIEVDYTATTGYKSVRIIPYGRDSIQYVNKNYESGTWSGWKLFKDYETVKAENDALYASKTSLALAVSEALNNITQDLSEKLENLNPVISGANDLISNLNKVNFDNTFNQIDILLSSMNGVFDDLESGNGGTLSLLLSDDSLYNNLNKTTYDLDKLLQHINENPKHFFAPLGKSKRKIEKDLNKQKEN